jgi:uncharacterized membrane protein YhaH (DUF805 family)
MDIYLKSIFYKYADFYGRMTRKEYWTFVLYHVVVTLVMAVTAGLYRQSILVPIYQLFILVPLISTGFRRMHDIGKSAWFFWVPGYNIYLLSKPGQTCENKFGNSIDTII